MYKIYGFTSFNPLKVVATAEELGLEYEYQHMDLGKRENHEPEHLARHPFGKVPVLEHEGNCLFESASICRYLARVNGDRLYTTDPLQAAKIDQIMDTMSLHIGRWLAVHFWEEVVVPKYMQQESNAKLLDEAKGWLTKQLPYVDKVLGSGTYLCGGELTIADTFAFAYFTIHETTSVSLDEYPNLDRWYKQLNERPTFQKALSVVSPK
ncbi:MAG: glutathione S-transferase family protein [Pseudohongiellaceae bacterium]